MNIYILIPGLICFLLFGGISILAYKKSIKSLSLQKRLLLFQQTKDLNKFTVSGLVAATILFFIALRELNLDAIDMLYTYMYICIAYIAVSIYFTYKQLLTMKLQISQRIFYIISRIALLAGLSIFIAGLFIGIS